jgi:hypothetical protein
MKITLKIMLAMIALVVIFTLFAIFSIYFAVIAAISEGTDVLKSLIDVDAALIGFLGIIMIFILSEYRGSMRRVEEKMDREKLDYESRRNEDSKIGYPSSLPMSSQLASAEAEYKAFNTQIQNLEKDLRELRQTHGGVILAVMMCVSSFVTSILASLVAMGIKDVPARLFPIYASMALMLAGVVFMFIIVIYFAYYN